MTLLLRIKDQEVKVALDKIRSSEYLMSILECFGYDDPIIFPPQYCQVADVYINFINFINEHYHHLDMKLSSSSSSLKSVPDKISYDRLSGGQKFEPKFVMTNISRDEIKQSFELCHYLLDQEFFEFLLEQLLHGWSHYNGIIISLHANIQRDIYLHLPYILLPNDYQIDTNFLLLWSKNNNEKHFRVNMREDYMSRVTFNENFNHSVIRGIKTYLSDEPHGISREWYEVSEQGDNKQSLRSEETLVGGYHDGECKFYYQSGQIESITYYKEGVMRRSTKYYDNGTLHATEEYDEKGEKTGIWKIWYPSGAIKWEMSWLHGMRHGYHRKYFDAGNGQPCLKRQYRFDKYGEVSIFREWYYHEKSDRNHLKHKFSYLDGNFRYIEWDEEGNKLIHVTKRDLPKHIYFYAHFEVYGIRNNFGEPVKTTCKYRPKSYYLGKDRHS